MTQTPVDPFRQRNESIRIELLDQPEDRLESALRMFFRRAGFPHVYRELFMPALAGRNSLVCLAVSDRPWPPWGIGAHKVHSLILVHPLTETGASLTNVFALPEELSNAGLQAAVYKEAVEELARRKIPEVTYLVHEGGFPGGPVLSQVGFEPTEDMFLTEDDRYLVYRASPEEHLRRLGLDAVSTPDLLANTFQSDTQLQQTISLLATIERGMRPFWDDMPRRAHFLPNTGGGLRADQPGGVPPPLS